MAQRLRGNEKDMGSTLSNGLSLEEENGYMLRGSIHEMQIRWEECWEWSPYVNGSWLLWKVNYVVIYWGKRQRFSTRVCVLCVLSQSCSTLCIPWTLAAQTPLSMGSCRKKTGVGCHFLLQRVFPTLEANLHLLHPQSDSLPLSHQGRL